MTDNNYSRTLGRLRALRIAAGLTLKQVEIKSRGKWKSVVVGSYERGTRHLSLMRAVELCEFYGADIAELGSHKSTVDSERLIFDLRQLALTRSLPDEFTQLVSRLVSMIKSMRGDNNHEVLTVRRSDLDNLQIISEMKRDELLVAMKRRALILEKHG